MKTSINKEKVEIDMHHPGNEEEVYGGMKKIMLSQHITKTIEYDLGSSVTIELRDCQHYIPIDESSLKYKEFFNNFESATLYKVLSNNPIISRKDDFYLYGISNTLPLKECYEILAEKQIVRKLNMLDDSKGDIILDDNGCQQYQRVLFSFEPHKDIDKRHKNY